MNQKVQKTLFIEKSKFCNLGGGKQILCFLRFCSSFQIFSPKIFEKTLNNGKGPFKNYAGLVLGIFFDDFRDTCPSFRWLKIFNAPPRPDSPPPLLWACVEHMDSPDTHLGGPGKSHTLHFCKIPYASPKHNYVYREILTSHLRPFHQC